MQTPEHWISILVAAAVALPAGAVTLQMGHRPEIGAISAPKSAKAGEAVKITVSARKEGGSGCGLLLEFGDGTDLQFKINVDSEKLPLEVAHAYKKNGRYTLRASGREITTHKGCKGVASAVIQVGPPKKSAKAKK
jgi:hypothetical protein